MTNYGDQFMRCPECGGTAEAECVDVGVGIYIKDEYECPCGYNSAADGRANVGSYDDWFPDLHKANGSRTLDALYQVCAGQWVRDLRHLTGKFGPPIYTR